MPTHHIALPSEAFTRYPAQPFNFSHDVFNESHLSVDALLEAAAELPAGMIEFTSDAPMCGASPPTLLTRLQSIETSRSWFIFRNLEQLPRYDELMCQLLDQICAAAPWLADSVLRPMCFAFLSSPGVETPLHIDPEHNFLFQIKGEKLIFINDPVRRPVLGESEIRFFYQDEVGYQLQRTPAYDEALEPRVLVPGAGLYIPVVAPHAVINGDAVSVSFSVTYRTARSETHRARFV